MEKYLFIIEKVEEIEPRYRLLIFVGTIFLLISFCVCCLYIPGKRDISKLEKKITGLEAKINEARIRTKNLTRFESELAQTDTQLKKALKLLPDKREIPNLLRTVTRLGKDSNLEFRLFSPKKERASDFYIEIPVAVELRGSYHNVAMFFDKVGRMERIVNIENVSMTPEKANSTILKTKCEAVTFRFKGKADDEAKKGKDKGRKKRR